VFSKTVFSIAQSTFRMYSVMAILKSSIVWGLFEYTEVACFLYCNHQVHRDVLINLYNERSVLTSVPIPWLLSSLTSLYSVMAIFFACFLYCNHQAHRDFLITLYIRMYGGSPNIHCKENPSSRGKGGLYGESLSVSAHSGGSLGHSWLLAGPNHNASVRLCVVCKT
jgi:hypothetical protein